VPPKGGAEADDRGLLGIGSAGWTGQIALLPLPGG
jgi:hypothetical protein